MATSTDRTGKACWNDRLVELFLKIAIQEVREGNRPTTHLSKKGWLNLQTKFNRVANVTYDMKQFKNKWENLKKEWQLWKRLVGKETGLGWNETKKTIEASTEWWDRKIKEIPAAAKFREKGLYLPEEMEMVFGDVVATGHTAWAPSLGNLPPPIGASTQVYPDHTEGSGDSDDNTIGLELPNLNLDAPSDIPVGASTYSPTEGDRDGGRKKGKRKKKSDLCPPSRSFKKHNSSSSSVSESLEKLAGVLVESNKSKANGISAADCMKVVSSLPIDRKGKFFYKCLTVLMKKREYREMLMTMDDPEMQLLYLQTLVEENSRYVFSCSAIPFATM